MESTLAIIRFGNLVLTRKIQRFSQRKCTSLSIEPILKLAELVLQLLLNINWLDSKRQNVTGAKLNWYQSNSYEALLFAKTSESLSILHESFLYCLSFQLFTSKYFKTLPNQLGILKRKQLTIENLLRGSLSD